MAKLPPPTELDRDNGPAEYLHLLLTCAREYAIFTVDPSNRIVTWNAGAERVLGWTREQAIGQSGTMIFTPEQQATGGAEAEMEAAKQYGAATDERWHLRVDGSRFWGSGQMIALYDDGVLRGFAKILRDRTQEKTAEAEREHLLQQLAEEKARLRDLNEILESRVDEGTRQVRLLAAKLTAAEQAERRRIADILHDDLQQLLFGIQIKLSLARSDADAPDRSRLHRELDGAYTLIEQAIATTRRLSVDLSPAMLKGEGLAGSLRWLAAQMWKLHGLRVDVEAPDALDTSDQVTREFLFLIARELLFNVVKHADVDRAEISLSATGNDLVLCISDEGVGFDPVAIGRRENGGYGFASIQERIALLGGTLEVDSKPAAGTTITIVVPLS